MAIVAFLFVLAFPATAAANAPSPNTDSPTITGATTAIFNGDLDTGGGSSTTYDFEYDVNSSGWCSSGGDTGSPAHTTSTQSFTSTADPSYEDGQVSTPVNGLTGGTAYCYRLVAQNSDGTVDGSTVSFVAGAPTANTNDAFANGETTATVGGSVDPAGQSTSVKAEFALAGDDWCTSGGTSGTPSATSPTTLNATDSSFHGVTVSITGLTSGQAYCGALVATNASGRSVPQLTTFTAAAPSAETNSVQPTGTTSEDVYGSVDPVGQATTYLVRYDLASSEWCENFGESSETPETSNSQSLAASSNGPESVLVSLSGLTAGASYCAEVVASNSGGTVGSEAPQTFTSGAPEVHTDDFNATSATTATVDGSVDPAGQSTTYYAEYALASSDWCQNSGSSGTPTSTSPQNLSASDSTFHNVTVDLTGLQSGTDYCAELVAQNATRTVSGQAAPGTTLSTGAPTVFPNSGYATGPTTATFNGSMESGAATTYHFGYGLASSSWCQAGGSSGSPSFTTSTQSLTADQASFAQVTADASGLTAGQSYCFALIATNTAGTRTSSIETFPAGAPDVSTDSVTTTSGTSVSVTGTVNPAGQSTTVELDYAPLSDTWCQSDASSGSPSTTTAQSLNATDSSPHDVTLSLSGLTVGTRYCVAISASNTSGTERGGTVETGGTTPSAETDDANPTGATTATVDGTVNPEGQSTTYEVQYDVSTSTWCENNGQAGSPSGTTTSKTLSDSSPDDHNVSVDLSGLTAGDTYCAQLVAVNASGTGYAFSQVTFTAGTPLADTFSAAATGATTAVAMGDVTPSGQTTSYFAEYALASSSWCQSAGALGTDSSTTPAPLGATDESSHQVSVDLSGLTAGDNYCVAIAATNAAGSATLETQPLAAGLPAASTAAATPTAGTTATVTGTVNPTGQSTSYYVRYGPENSTWCQDQGTAGSPAFSTSPATLGFTDDTDHDVSGNLTGLTAGAQYCAAIAATNTGGTASGQPAQFTAGLPSATTTQAQLTGATAATVTGTVNPAGQATSYYVQYDVSGSQWCETQGQSGAPTNSTAATSLMPTDDASHDVSVNLTGLSSSTTYCAAIAASNGAGTATGSPTFVAPASSQSAQVEIDSVAPTSSTAAAVAGTVDPEGQSTTYFVQYGPASSSWCQHDGQEGTPASSTTPQSLGASDESSHGVSVTLSSLTAGSTYCAAIAATASSVTTTSDTLQFVAGAPTATTDDAQPTGASTATVDGEVDPGGQSTSYHVQYGLSSSNWCQSDGVVGTPAHTTAAASVGATDTNEHAVSPGLTGLTSGTSYCAQLTATNTSATANGGQVEFTTNAGSPGQSPTVSAGSASSVTASGATLSGTVNPNSQTTSYEFSYALSTDAWCTSGGMSGTPTVSPETPGDAGSGASAVNESAPLTGLAASTSYCWALSATNDTGTSATPQNTFTTSAAAPPPQKPTVTAGSPVSVSSNSETLSGTVNPNGESTSYSFSYAQSTATWCTSDGASGTPTTTTPGNAGSGSSAVNESAPLTSLTASTSYCWSMSATNTTGTSTTVQNTFTTAAASGPPAEKPTVTAGTPTSVSPTSETLSGSVNPNDATTSYLFAYAPNSAQWCTSSGVSGTPTNTTSQPAGSGSAAANESTTLTGLTASTGYCWELSATNTTGTSTTSQETFTTASTPPSKSTLTVTTAGSGSGTVTGSGISCPGTCSQSYTDGTNVTLTATASSGSTFAGWTGACTGTGTCTDAMSSDKSVTATFNTSPPPPPPPPPLTLTPTPTPTPTPPKPSPTGQAVNCSLKLVSSQVTLKKPKKGKSKTDLDSLSLTERCNQATSTTLTGKITETIPKKGSKKASSKAISTSTVRRSVSANQPLTITITLPGSAISGLKKHYKESAIFTLTAPNASRAATATAGRLRGVG